MFTKNGPPWFLYPSFICSKHCLHFILRSCSTHNPFLIVMESKYRMFCLFLNKNMNLGGLVLLLNF